MGEQSTRSTAFVVAVALYTVVRENGAVQRIMGREHVEYDVASRLLRRGLQVRAEPALVQLHKRDVALRGRRLDKNMAEARKERRRLRVALCMEETCAERAGAGRSKTNLGTYLLRRL